jgi:endonuclease/exonuclease/phosphatase (EEP) superfamily protein YafD
MAFLDNVKGTIGSGKWVAYAGAALLLFNVLGLLAAYHWLFDVFVHFKLQYFIAALVLFVAALAYRRAWLAVCMAALSVCLFAELQFANSHPFAKVPSLRPNLTLVQYNKYYYSDDYDDIGAWIRNPANDFDIIIVNESSPESLKPMAEQFGDVFPHQYPDDYLQRFNDISVLSKWPFTIRPQPMEKRNGQIYNVSKINLYKNGLEPVVIYAYHTQTPVGPNDAALRNFELEEFSAIIANQQEENVIAVGDWNITPYSPHFRDILKTTGLSYQNYGWFPQTTWPRYGGVRFLKIPIDHVLFDDSLALVSLKAGPTFESDHNSLVAKFAVPEEKSAE